LWFETIKAGLEQCAKDYGFKATITGPPKADPAIQAQIVLDNIGRNFDAIAVCPLDDAIIDSAFERANKTGVMTFGNEGYSLKNVTFDIEPMSNKAFGEAMMESAIEYTSGNGNYLISVGFLNSKAQNAWADAEIEYQKKNAAGLNNILGYASGSDRFEDNEDQKVAAEKLTAYIDNNKDLNLIIGNSSSTGIAAGELIAKKKLKGKLFYIGTGLPIVFGEFLKEGTIQEGFFWDPYLSGYSIGYIALQSWLGNDLQAGSSVVKPDGTKLEGYENLELETNAQGGNVIYGENILSVNKDNLDSWYEKFSEYGWPQQ
ncbi:MAG: substrate-binding domain-containing protein, partial [Actinobacteria bacterium]|nr:substrate-binding domain-containing protein [Actinomycetota bacterium]